MITGIKPKYLVFCLLFLTACTSKSGQTIQPQVQQKTAARPSAGEVPLQKVMIYLENSESMFGYVSAITEYVDVVSELAEMPELVKNKVPREFYFINGNGPEITPVGNNPSVLREKLNRTGFNCGDITKSNLNGMFQTALKNAGNGVITLLISDGIYDIGGAGVTSLVTEGKATRSRFINRLTAGDLQTIIVKLRSQFNGDYFYTSQKGKIRIQSIRPYYLWIMGESHLLNKYFPNEYITGQLTGCENMARFLKPGTAAVPYQATAENSIGTFRFDHKIPNKLSDAKSDTHGLGFQFSIAADYSKLPYPEEYLTSPENYTVNNKNYSVVSVTRPSGRIHSVPFTPTHLVTVKTMKYPAGQLVISLVNNLPAWIAATHSDTENNIAADKTHTFGFSYLVNGIIEAYESVAEDADIAGFKIDIH